MGTWLYAKVSARFKDLTIFYHSVSYTWTPGRVKSCSLRWPTTVTAKEITSRQKKETHGKKEELHGKKEKAHSKIKNLAEKRKRLMAKEKTSQPSRLSLMPWGHCYFFCREVISLAMSLLLLPWGFFFAVSLFSLPWGFFFCREVFPFAVNLFLLPFVFAAKLFLWPWILWATVVPRFYSSLGGLTFDMLLYRISLERWDLLLRKLILRSDKLIYTACGGTPCPLQTYFISVCY